MLFCSQLIFFKINFFRFFSFKINCRKIISRKDLPSKCQTDLTQIRPNILLGLIWVQTVCKGYQQATLVGNVSSVYLFIHMENTRKTPEPKFFFHTFSQLHVHCNKVMFLFKNEKKGSCYQFKFRDWFPVVTVFYKYYFCFFFVLFFVIIHA